MTGTIDFEGENDITKPTMAITPASSQQRVKKYDKFMTLAQIVERASF